MVSSALTPCGLTQAAREFFRTMGYDDEEVYGAFWMLYLGAPWASVADHMEAKFGRGWCLRSCKEKIPRILKEISDRLGEEWLTPRKEWVQHAKNTTGGVFVGSSFPSTCWDPKMAFDTVPIYVDGWDNCCNPKYGSKYVVKLFSGCLFTGFIITRARRLYTGSTCDKVIQDGEVIESFLKEHDMHALADGGFHPSPRVAIPYPKTSIWPTHLKEKQSLEEYYAEAETKLRDNELFGFWRGRIEHVFSRVCLGRWRIFKHWHLTDCMLLDAVMIVHNIEIWERHRDGGKYKELTPVKIEEVKNLALRHPLGSSRYPTPKEPPAPFGSKKRTLDSQEGDVDDGNDGFEANPLTQDMELKDD